MRKIVFLILICTLFSAKLIIIKKNDNLVQTIIEENDNMLISINYPKTGISKLDNQISIYVKKTYKNFKDEYEMLQSLTDKAELNIDYTYDKVNEKYINITIYTYINSGSFDQSVNDIYTIVFDKSKKKILNIKDILDEKNLNLLSNYLKIELKDKYKDCISTNLIEEKLKPNFNNFSLYTFNSKSLKIYFKPYEISNNDCGIINVEIPFSKINILITIKEEFTYTNISYDILKNSFIDPKKPVVALTFDDGPSNYTNEIIEVLKENNAYATFFVLGNKIRNYKDTIKKTIKYGNEIGNHSYNHRLLTRLSTEQLNNQINKTQDLIEEITGYTPQLLRPTYGAVSKRVRNNTNLKIVLWDLDTLDWKIKDSKKIANKTINKVRDGDIILMHDTYERTLKAIKIIVPELQKRGYQFVTISELEKINIVRQKTINE